MYVVTYYNTFVCMIETTQCRHHCAQYLTKPIHTYTYMYFASFPGSSPACATYCAACSKTLGRSLGTRLDVLM